LSTHADVALAKGDGFPKTNSEKDAHLAGLLETHDGHLCTAAYLDAAQPSVSFNNGDRGRPVNCLAGKVRCEDGGAAEIESGPIRASIFHEIHD